MGKIQISIVGCCILTALAVEAVPAFALPRADHAWVDARTEHFVLTGDADADRLRGLAWRLENLRRVLAVVPGELDLTPRRPELILVFRDWSSSRGYFPDELRGGRVGGTYLGTAFADRILINAGPDLDPFALICHEYLHLVVRRNYPGLPLWLEEGLAEFYTTFWADDERAEIGAVHDEYLQRLRAEGLMPLEELFAVTADDPIYQGVAAKQRFHAQAWATVHYLMMAHPERRLELWSRLTRWRDRGGTDARTWDVFDAPLPELTPRIAAYVETLELPRFRWSGAEGLDRDEVAVAPLDRATAATRLGELLIDRGPEHFKRARKHLALAQKLDPEHDGAQAGLGRLALAGGDATAAGGHFARAAALAPTDGLHPYMQARSLLAEVWQGRLPVPLSAPESPDPRIAQARELLERATRLLPDHTDVRARLGYTYLFARGGGQRGIEVLEAAHEMQPGRLDVAYYLMVLMLRDGRRDDAERIVAGVLGRAADPAWTERATTALARYDLRAARNMMRSGETERASELLRELLDRPLGSALRREVERDLARAVGGG